MRDRCNARFSSESGNRRLSSDDVGVFLAHVKEIGRVRAVVPVPDTVINHNRMKMTVMFKFYCPRVIVANQNTIGICCAALN